MSLSAAAVALPPFSVHLATFSALRPLVSPPFRRSHCILRVTKPPRRRPPRHPSRCSASTSVAGVGDEITRSKLLWRAVKLPIYSVALVPLTVGSSAAYLQTGIFFARRYAVLLVASILIITWLNLSNDVYDFDTGADRNKKESVVNIIGSRRIAHFMANISLLLGFVGLIWACTEAGDIRSMILLTLAIMCGFVYQCPPFRLSYQGLGEPLCFSAFGPFATTAFFLSQNSRISRQCNMASRSDYKNCSFINSRWLDNYFHSFLQPFSPD